MAKKKSRTFRVGFLILLVCVLSAYFILQFIEKTGKLNDKSKAKIPLTPLKARISSPPEAAQKDKIAILIDDLGPNLKEFHQLKNLHPNLSFAVLPFQTYSLKIAREVQSGGHHDLLLHLPMEAESQQENPGKGAILHSMKPEEIARQTRSDLQAIPNIQGVNNHMGSKITSDSSEMKIILQEISLKQLYFIDSRTTSNSVAYSLAEKMGIKAAERQVFLDDTDQLEDITKEFERLIDLAHQRGAAIAIGHPRPNTIRALKTFLSRAGKESLDLVPVSSLVR